MPFRNLSDLLYGSIRKKGLSFQVEAALVLETFSQIAIELWGDEVKKMMRPLYLKDQVLTIAVLSPGLAQEIKLSEGKIIARVNQKMGAQAVASIRYLS